MLEKTEENFYIRNEAFTDENSQVTIDGAIKVGVRVLFDFTNEIAMLTEIAYSSQSAFESGAGAIPQSERTHVLSADEFANFIKKHPRLVKDFKTLFEATGEKEKERIAAAAQSSRAARDERFEQLKKEIEASGGKVTLPADNDK